MADITDYLKEVLRENPNYFNEGTPEQIEAEAKVDAKKFRNDAIRATDDFNLKDNAKIDAERKARMNSRSQRALADAFDPATDTSLNRGRLTKTGRLLSNDAILSGLAAAGRTVGGVGLGGGAALLGTAGYMEGLGEGNDDVQGMLEKEGLASQLDSAKLNALSNIRTTAERDMANKINDLSDKALQADEDQELSKKLSGGIPSGSSETLGLSPEEIIKFKELLKGRE